MYALRVRLVVVGSWPMTASPCIHMLAAELDGSGAARNKWATR